MKVWITGARGFLGRHAIRHLAALGHEIVGLGHGAWLEREFQMLGLSDWLNGEISHSNLGALMMKHGAPSSVIHLAGGSSVGPSFAAPAEDFRRSVGSSAVLAEWLRLQAPEASVVLASSAAVYGAGHDGPIAEDMSCQPFSPYGFNKRMSELLFESYARNFGMKVGIVRLFSVYGPELRKQLLWDACSRLATGNDRLELGGTGDEMRDWFHVQDAVRLMALMLERASPTCPVVNGGTGKASAVREVAAQLCLSWGGVAKPMFSGQSRSGDPAYLVADTTSLAALGFCSLRDWRDGLSEYVAWFKATNRVKAG